MSKILLIYPDPRGVFPRMPNSVLPLAGYLIKRGIDAQIFDGQFEDVKDVDFKKYDFICFSVQFTGPQITSALKIAQHLRSAGIKTPFIWGGIHPTITPEETAANKYVDIVVRGEGEETLYQLIKMLSSGSQIEDVEGITYKAGEKIISTPDRNFIDLDELPLLPYHLLKHAREYSELKRKPTYVSIGTSRGCPYNCGFCYVKAVHRMKWRCMSPERAVKEIEHIISFFKPEMIIANDDNMFVDLGRVEKIAKEMVRKGFNIKWSGGVRFDTAVKFSPEFWDLLISSGCTPNFGGESGSTEILKMMNKGIEVEQIIKTVKQLKQYKDINPYANYMFGFPEEKWDDIKATFNLIDMISRENRRFYCGISVYTPYPKTPLYAMSLEHGFIPPSGLEQWGHYKYNEVSNLPWLKGFQRSIIRTVTLFTHFRFNQPLEFGVTIPGGNLFYKIAFILFTISARIRWKLKYFWMPVEWRLYEYMCRIMGISER